MRNAAELAAKASNLITLPDIYLRLLKLLYDENSTAQQMADLIGLDAGLAARLLKIANSSFYSFPAEIETIHRAITVIGSRELSNLVLATSVAASFRGVPENLIDMDSFWRHNVDTAMVAHHLGRKLALRASERLFVVGLLHNIGKMVVLSESPVLARDALRVEFGQPPWEHEHEVLGFTFADCGQQLLKIWGLPEVVVEGVACQHDPESAKIDPASAAIIHISNRTASFLELEAVGSQPLDLVGTIDDSAWGISGVQEDDLSEAIEYAQLEAWNILSLITVTI